MVPFMGTCRIIQCKYLILNTGIKKHPPCLLPKRGETPPLFFTIRVCYYPRMKRKALVTLQSWYSGKNRKPLILRGARQVGKSTLVRLFAQENELELIEINFEKTLINSLTTSEINIEIIIQEIEYKTNKSLQKKSLLFFDEIQENPKAIAALRYFYEERPEIALISAGSLLEFTLNQNNFSMPVGRIEYMHIGPMTFVEFLWAMGHNKLGNDLINQPETTALVAFEQLAKLLREFYAVGGMPEAIKAYTETNNLEEVINVHRSIMETYIDDFHKYATTSESHHLNTLIQNIPTNLGKKVKLNELIPNAKQAVITKCLTLLEQAKLIIKCHHTNASGIPIHSQMDNTVFKIYFLDIGLMNHLLGLTPLDIIHETDEKLLTEGIQAEQFFAQHLKYLDPYSGSTHLTYWLRDKKRNNAEVDFIIQRSKDILPIEIKSGKSGSLKSLIYFMATKKNKKAFRFDLKKREHYQELISTSVFNGSEQIKTNFKLFNYPLFLVECINKLV